MLTLDEVQKYIATQRGCAEGENLIERICATREEITRSVTRTQAYQACRYNKSYCVVEYKVGQKVWLRVKNITIE